MEPSTAETAAQTVKGLAVLAAIPVALFALWADYYSRYLKSARKSMPGFDPRIERERVRVAGACVLLFEFILTIGGIGTLELYPKGAVVGVLLCIMAVGFIQTGLEKQLMPASLSSVSAHKDTKRNTMTGWRALLLALMSGVLYILTLVVFVKSASLISTHFHFPTLWASAFIMTAAAAGIFAGLTLNFALAPWQIRHSLPVCAMSEEEKATISAPMESSGLRNVSYWIVEDRLATAAVAGFRRGSGIFQPAVFVSRTVMTTLTKAEITAVVAHEAAHVLAQHLRKRVLLSASLIVGLTFMAVFLSLAVFTLFPQGSFQGGFGVFFGMAAFTLAFLILQKQSRVHEFEADWIAIHKLGADFDSWAAALRKMDQLNGLTTRRGPLSSHPRTELRIQNVAKMLAYFGRIQSATPAQPDPDHPDHKDKAA